MLLQEGGTPLLLAAYKGHLAMAKLLLDRGAKIDAADKVLGSRVGTCPLFYLRSTAIICIGKV